MYCFQESATTVVYIKLYIHDTRDRCDNRGCICVARVLVDRFIFLTKNRFTPVTKFILVYLAAHPSFVRT